MLVEKLPAMLNRYGKSLFTSFYAKLGVLPNSFSFSLVTNNQVLKYLEQLSANKATGLDSILSRLKRDGASIITQTLTHVINLSVIQGVVPGELKSARVILIVKKHDKTDVGN
jgi:hypothetical protein